MKSLKIVVAICVLLLSAYAQKKQNPKLCKSSYYDLVKTSDSLCIVSKFMNDKIQDLQVAQNLRENEFYNKLDFQSQALALSEARIASAIALSDRNLTRFSLAIAIFGVLLGVYIKWMHMSMSDILSKSRVLLKQQKEVMVDVTNTKALIENDMLGLYHKIGELELKHMIKRLLLYPEDIANLDKRLASIEIPSSYFEEFKGMALEIHRKKYARNYLAQGEYLTILFQHFPEKTFFDIEIAPLLLRVMDGVVRAFFEHDLQLAVERVLKQASISNFQNQHELLKKLFSSIQGSVHKDSEIVLSKAYESCLTKENKFSMFEILEPLVSLNSTKYFASSILKEFENDDNTSAQSQAIDRISQI